MSPARLLPCGECAVLVELADLDEVLALAERLRGAALPGVTDIVPAARTVLVGTRSPAHLDAIRPTLAALVRDRTVQPGGQEPSAGSVVITVHYDGQDLDEVARLTGLSPAEVVGAHTGTTWRAAFGGFAPGFTYLTGGDPRLHVPRRATPRTAVPAGAVGLAGEFSGIYPRSSPGGWQLIGRTEAVLWDVNATPPALIRPGMQVRFEVAR